MTAGGWLASPTSDQGGGQSGARLARERGLRRLGRPIGAQLDWVEVAVLVLATSHSSHSVILETWLSYPWMLYL